MNEYFDAKLAEAEDKSSEDQIYKGYRAVLDSKSVDETLVSFFFHSCLLKTNTKSSSEMQ